MVAYMVPKVLGNPEDYWYLYKLHSETTDSWSSMNIEVYEADNMQDANASL